jgi:aldose 1-epimerase
MAATSDLLHLSAGALSADLVPGIGGSLAALRLGTTDLMRPLSAADRAAGNVLGVAMFPMIPYANRIEGNCFDFDGRTYRVEANNPPEAFNVHGTGWHRPWSVDHADGAEASLSLALHPPEGPYLYHATQHFRLDAAGLTVTLQVTNDAKQTMPFGFGLHPWFPRDPDATLQFAARTFYLEEPGHLAGDPVTLPPELDFVTERGLPDRWRNNDYGGWDGAATLRFPSRGLGLRMSADPVFRHLMVYADPGRPVFCVEPQTNASGAFNRRHGFRSPDEGVLILPPGGSAYGSVRFEVFRLR